MRNRKLYIPDSCRKCDRESSCTYPCEDAYNEFKMQNPQNQENSLCNETYNQPIARVSEDDTYNKTTHSCGCEKDENNIEDFLEFSVENVEWLRVVNSKISYTELIDKSAFLSYLEGKNEKYCEENGLCIVCRNPLEKFDSYEEVSGSRRLVEIEFRCPYGCS